MALSLQQIRDYVRTHLDIEEEDLPDTLLDAFIREGSQKIEKAESRWPFYEVEYPLDTTPGQSSYPLSVISGELDQVAGILGPSLPLRWIGPDQLNQLASPTTSTHQGEPRAFTVRAGSVIFFPTPDVVYTLRVAAYRKPQDWIAAGAGAEPDMDEVLHNTIAVWALSRAYAQQEDPEMAAFYVQVFNEQLTEYSSRIHETPHPQPMVLNGTRTRRSSLGHRLRYSWE